MLQLAFLCCCFLGQRNEKSKPRMPSSVLCFCVFLFLFFFFLSLSIQETKSKKGFLEKGERRSFF